MCKKSGVYATLIFIFQFGKREELLGKIELVFAHAKQEPKGANTILRKQTLKLVQRIALTFLPPRVVAWRYQKTRLSLLSNLKSASRTSQEDTIADNDDDSFDVPEQMEEIIEKLLTGLRDKDTVVRWSAAKGVGKLSIVFNNIGRVTLRLPKQFGDDIVKSVMELFDPFESMPQMCS